MAACGLGKVDDCDDCVQVVRDIKTVQIPCTRNTYKEYTVKVARQVTEQIPRAVTYTDYESREKQVPYTVMRPERRIRMETQKYQVPVTTYYRKTTMETQERQVPVPYYVNVQETKYRTISENVPVQRSKVEMDEVVKTVYDTETRTRCVPQTKIVRKVLPVYNVVPKPQPPCPPDSEGGGNIMSIRSWIDKEADTRLNDKDVAHDEAMGSKITKQKYSAGIANNESVKMRGSLCN